MPCAERTMAERVRTSSASLASSLASILSRSSVVKVLRGGECIGCPRMPEVAVVTDSTAYLTPQLTERYGLEVVPLYVVFGGDRTVRETEITDFPAFFEELRQAESLPTTSQPSVGDFTSVFEPLLASGKDVISIHISAGLSGTAEAARQAAEALEREGKGGERVSVIDSETAAGGLGLLAMVAGAAAGNGSDARAIEQRVREARRELKMWFAIDTLEFLKRGGRIGAASAWIGSTLKVKPILTVESELTPVERVRTSARMFERMVDYARQRHESGADGWAVQHINAPEQCEELAARCREVFGSDPALVSEIGPVLSAHTGPGLLGVGSLPRHFLN
jgi:DegV family protein with EDD domain